MMKTGKWISAVVILVSGIVFAVVVANICLAPRTVVTALRDEAALVPAEHQIRIVYAYGGMDALTKYCARTVIAAFGSYMTCEVYTESVDVGDDVTVTTYATEDEAVAELQFQEYWNTHAGVSEGMEIFARFARDPIYEAIADRTYESKGDPIYVHRVILPEWVQ